MAVRTRQSAMPAAAPLLGAAATTLAPLLDGPVHPARVVGTVPTALHVVADDPRVPLICVCTPEAVRLPCSMVVPGPLPAHLGRASVGNGFIRLGDTWIGVGRWWRPLRPRFSNPDEPLALVQTARRLLDPLEPDVATAVPALIAWLSGRPAPGAVSALVGRGGGLTPCGDDLLCGALVALRALGDLRGRRLASAVARVAAVQTTHVSTALLVHASRGECIPELAGFVAALDGRGDVAAAVRQLVRVGHSSGNALAHGVLLALTSRAGAGA